MKDTIAKTFLSLTMIVILSSCSSSYVKLDETHTYQKTPSVPYGKVMVVGVMSPQNFRHSFENIFADALQRHGVAAIASHKLIDDLTQANKAQIQRLAQQTNADAVAITRVLSKSEHTSYKLSTGHVEYRTVAKTTTSADSSSTIAMSGVGIVAGEMDSAGAVIQTNFFDASSAELMWTAITNAAGGVQDKMDVCWELSFVLSEALGKDHLIEITSADVKIPKL